MKEMAMLIDSSNCIGCKACMMACKQENGLSVGNNFLKVWLKESLNDHFVKFYAHNSCRHCYEPQCEAACPVGAIKRNDDGIVLHDELKCIGCQVCVSVCPHAGIRMMNNGLVGKCNLCKERLSSGLSPACVSVCPTNARLFDLKGEIIQIATERQAELENQGYETQLDGIYDGRMKVFTLLPKR